ncbi:MAG: PilN domain-containing protein, partial [Granulosicoccaceae bacterium]
QQVNLYQPMFRRQEKRFSARTLLVLFAATAIVFSAVYAYARWNVHALQKQLTELQAQYQTELKRIDELARQYPLQRKSQQAQARLEKLRRERSAREKLINVLRGQTLGNTDGFSAHLEAMSRRRVQGMWLTDFHLSGSGERVSIKGGSLSAELVPQFLQKLSDEEAFAGTEFRVFRMQRDPEKRAAINFVLQSREGEGS